MAADFEKAVRTILAHEGGLVDHPADPGGITNFGISINFVKRIFPLQEAFGMKLPFEKPDSPDRIRNLTRSEAIVIYRVCWWDFFGFGRINDQQVATKIFDMAVNMGPPNQVSAGSGKAFELVQRALNALGKGALENGLFTPYDVNLINECDPQQLLTSICNEQKKFYENLAKAKPSMAVFLPGWLRRARWPF